MKHFCNSAATGLAVHQFHTQDDMFLVKFKQILLSRISWSKISTKIMQKMKFYTHYSRQQTIGVRHCQSQDGMYKLNFWHILSVWHTVDKFLAGKLSQNETFLYFSSQGISCTAFSMSGWYACVIF